MTNKNNYEILRGSLYALLKMDYKIELYNYNENSIKLSFYHLNSVYNAFVTSVNMNGWSDSFIDYQYATKNKKATSYARRAISAVIAIYEKEKNFDNITKEFSFYGQRANAVFNAKYDLKTALHSVNVNGV